MDFEDKITAVSRMQSYIATHLDEEISLDALAKSAGYSKYHASRIFKELSGQAPFKAIRALRLTKAAHALQNSGAKVLNVALDNGFDSHDGFTQAFARSFGITPQRYQKETPAVRWFVPHSIEDYYILKEGLSDMKSENVSRTITVTVVERPVRKLIFLRASQATDYFSMCEELGCDWEGYFASISEAYESGAGGLLPKHLIKSGTSGCAFYVEVPADYSKPLPDGYEIAELQPCTYLYFRGMPFDDQNNFRMAIGILNEAIEKYPFEKFGWERSDDAPFLGMGAEAKTGACTAVPVKKRASV